MAPVLVTLNDPEGRSPVAGLFRCNPSNICAAFYQISTESALAHSLSDSWASCLYVNVQLTLSKVLADRRHLEVEELFQILNTGTDRHSSVDCI